MAQKRTIGLALLIGGIVFLIISVAADAIGIGWNPVGKGVKSAVDSCSIF